MNGANYALEIIGVGSKFVSNPDFLRWVHDETPDHTGNDVERAYRAIMSHSRNREVKCALRGLISDNAQSLHEALFRHLSGATERPKCSLGKEMKFDRQRLYGYCGTQSTCPCFAINLAEKYSEKVAARTRDDVEKINDKRKATFTDRYGVDNPLKVEDIKQRVHAGRDNTEIMKRMRTKTLEKFGVENAMQNPEVAARARDSLRKSSLEKHGVNHPNQMNYSPETFAILSDSARFEQFVAGKSNNTAARELGVHNATISLYRAKYDLGLDTSSSYECEIANFLASHEVQFEQNIRAIIAPYELDFFIPQHRLAIEFNGLYWHSTAKIPNKNYHFEKWKRCQDANIRLLMINEDEWLDNSAAIKAKIVNLLGLSPRGYGARQLTIREISGPEASHFIEQHHIQGRTSVITSAFGAFHHNEMVGVMAFNKQRSTQKIELIRFCSDGKSHPGMFSRMFHHAIREKQYSEVISFADLRYSDGGVYAKNGFILEGRIAPDYRYVRGDKTFHKSTFQKKAISRKFGIDVSQKTEKQLMEELEYTRIYDCGKLKFVWKDQK